MRSPYPLQWPQGWKRTEPAFRRAALFKVGLAQTRDGIVRELDLLGSANGMITSDLPIRADGMPYANGRSSDPGIAVWFVLDGKERVFACDRWIGHAANMRAIEMSLAAIRGLDRWGASDLVTRVFSGFAALPQGGDSTSTSRPWREVLGIAIGETVFPAHHQLTRAKEAHRALIREHHPDRGGEHAVAAELNAAIAEAERELGDADDEWPETEVVDA